MREVMLIVHFIGLAMGLGTSFAFMFLGMGAAKVPPEERALFMYRTLAVGKMGHIGLVLLVLSGIYLIIPYWATIGDNITLIIKLVMVLVLGALIGMISSHMKKIDPANPGPGLAKIKSLGPLSLITAIIIVILAVYTFH